MIDLGRRMCIFHLLVKILEQSVYVVRFDIRLPSMINTEGLFSSNESNYMLYALGVSATLKVLCGRTFVQLHIASIQLELSQ